MRIPVLSWVVSVLVLAGLMAWLGTGILPHQTNSSGSGAVDVGGAFTLVDGTGTRVTEKHFSGKYMLVFFGFTHCPDVCPTTLALINGAIGKLGKKADMLASLFITVDPERDTPKVVGDYVKHFGNTTIGLSGSPEQIKKTLATFKVYSSKIENENTDMGYMMDHSSFLYLMGPDGKYIAHFPSTLTEQALAEQLASHIQ